MIVVLDSMYVFYSRRPQNEFAIKRSKEIGEDRSSVLYLGGHCTADKLMESKLQTTARVEDRAFYSRSCDLDVVGRKWMQEAVF